MKKNNKVDGPQANQSSASDASSLPKMSTGSLKTNAGPMSTVEKKSVAERMGQDELQMKGGQKECKAYEVKKFK